MKQLLEAVMAKLEWDVPQLQWIDMNVGQMYADDPPVHYPCALVDISQIRYANLTASMQTCEVYVEVTLHFAPLNLNGIGTPSPVSVTSLEQYEVAESLYKALHGVALGSFSPLSCIEMIREKEEYPRHITFTFSCTNEAFFE